MVATYPKVFRSDHITSVSAEEIIVNRIFCLALFLFIIYSAGYSQFQKFEYGIISYYGDEFEGKKTASGEIYDGSKLTAAHRLFPFGSIIQVENMENGRKVTLKVNDRGPYAANRVLDVSKKAADDLGFLQKGTVYARITLIKLGDNKVVDIIQTSSSSSMSNTNMNELSSSALSSNLSSMPGLNATNVSPTNAGHQYLFVVTTNIVELFSTNQLILTNFVAIPVTNIVNIEPYEEKVVENDLSQSNAEAFSLDTNGKKPGDEFVLDENALKTPVPLEEAGEKGLTNQGEKTYYTEKEVPPETLLSNETAVRLDGKDEEGPDTNKEPVMVEKFSQGEKGASYMVQAGAYRTESSALKLYDLLKRKNYDVFTTESDGKGKKWIRVRIGYFNTIEEARIVYDELKKQRINPLIIKVKK